MTADHRASEFLEKCHGLPLHPGDRVAIERIERNIRCGLWKYFPDQAILVTDDGCRVKVYPDGRLRPGPDLAGQLRMGGYAAAFHEPASLLCFDFVQEISCHWPVWAQKCVFNHVKVYEKGI
jgi:hypothetical protein